MLKSNASLVVFALVLGLGMGCELALSQDEARARFEAYVDGANHCATAQECAVASAGCPLGCFTIVRADRKADVEAKARELIKDYERGGQSCQYDCATLGPLLCTDGRCRASPAVNR